MPTYAYSCPKCGHAFERFQKITDPLRARCPQCRAAAKRVITGGGGFLLKGSGFYATDYRSESYKKAAREESPEGGKVDRASGTAGEPGAGAESGHAAERATAGRRSDAAVGGETTAPEPGRAGAPRRPRAGGAGRTPEPGGTTPKPSTRPGGPRRERGGGRAEAEG